MLKLGFAKSFFIHEHQNEPWLPTSERVRDFEWPLMATLFSQKRMTYLDYVLVSQLLREYPDIGEESALFLCHVILATKEGHICIHVTENSVTPSVRELWQNEEGILLTDCEESQLTDKILTGSRQIPKEILTICDKNPHVPLTPLCRERNLIYLQRSWNFETLFLTSLYKHLQTPPTLILEKELISQSLQELYTQKILLKEQSDAILQACLSPLTIISGGPGTGKTYTAGQLIKIFWQSLTVEQRKTCQIILTAPTGKATANLQKSLTKATSLLENSPSIQSKTLHSLLGIRQSGVSHEQVRLTADLIVVDECSMIDIRIMAYLFEALKPGSRIILLGDQHQLPSIEAGSVFADLLASQEIPGLMTIPQTRLSFCMRAELQTLIDFSQLVNHGMAQEVLHALSQSNPKGIKRLTFHSEKKQAQREFLNYVVPFFPLQVHSEQTPIELLELFQTIRLLSPVRKGLFGVESLNQMILKRITQNLPTHGWIALPILIVSNDYQQELFNGETGVLVRRLPLDASIGSNDYALFPSREEEKPVRTFSALQLPKYEWAFCLSVHKSQGSEFERVILVLPEGAERFGREVFYTAITRARKSLEIYGSDDCILKTIEQRDVRLSGIKERLQAH